MFGLSTTWIVSKLPIVSLVLTVIILALLAALKYQDLQMDTLVQEKGTLTAKAFKLQNDVDALKGALARADAIQAQVAERAANQAKAKGDIDEAINNAAGDDPVPALVIDTIKRVSRRRQASTGSHSGAAAGKPTALRR